MSSFCSLGKGALTVMTRHHSNSSRRHDQGSIQIRTLLQLQGMQSAVSEYLVDDMLIVHAAVAATRAPAAPASPVAVAALPLANMPCEPSGRCSGRCSLLTLLLLLPPVMILLLLLLLPLSSIAAAAALASLAPCPCHRCNLRHLSLPGSYAPCCCCAGGQQHPCSTTHAACLQPLLLQLL